MVISDKIKPYSVMVKWNNKLAGSGVLVKSKDNKSYLFTARHLFKRDGGTFKGVKESHIKEDLKNIFINKENSENNILVDELLYFREDLDLVVFSLKEEPPIQHLPIVKILKNDHQTQNYYFYGYPNGSDNTGHLQDAKYIQSNEKEKHVFRLSAKNNFDGDEISGYSGSGIFVESKEEIKVDNDEFIENSIIYLVGLLIRAEDRLTYYEGVDLSGIIDDINDKKNIEIPIIEDVIDTKFTQHIETKILKRNREDNFIQQIKKLDANETLLKEFFDNSENELTEMTKKIADFYLLGGIFYKDNKHEESAKKYFRLATKFNPKYKRYEKGYKGKNIELEKTIEEKEKESISYYHEGIIAFQDEKKHSDAEEAFLKYLEKEDAEDFEKLESYKYLSKIYFKEKNYVDAEVYATRALDEYGKNNILEKAELCYQLFEICEKSEKECTSSTWIDRGLEYIRESKSEDNKDENLLIIERKLEKEEKELEKDDYINKMSPTLFELVQLYPEDYIKEFIDEYKNSRENEGKNYKTISSKVKDLQDYLEEINNVKDSKDDNEINP